MADLDAIRERDRQAECADLSCHPAAHDRRALLTYIDEREGQWRRSTAVLIDVHEEEMRRIAGEPIKVMQGTVTNGGVCPYCGMSTWVTDHCSLPWCEGFREVLQ